MSQIKFPIVFKGKKATVMVGWDYPLQYYHFTIFNDEAKDDDDEILFGGLDHGFPKFLAYWIDHCRELGIQVPEGTWDLVEKRERNFFYNYNEEKKVYEGGGF